MVKIADSAEIKQYMPTRPREGSSHVILASEIAAGGALMRGSFIRISSRDLPGACDPTGGGGCGPLESPRSCMRVGEKRCSTLESTHPRDRFPQSHRGSMTKAGWQRKPKCPRPGRTHR